MAKKVRMIIKDYEQYKEIRNAKSIKKKDMIANAENGPGQIVAREARFKAESKHKK